MAKAPTSQDIPESVQPRALWTMADDVHFMSPSPTNTTDTYQQVLVLNPTADPMSVAAAAASRVGALYFHLSTLSALDDEDLAAGASLSKVLFALQAQADEARQLLAHLQRTLLRP